MGLKEREETTITIEANFSMLKEVEETTTMTMNGINKLPDEMIHHILSFLPLKSAVSTSVLSKRWRHQWTFTPTLIFGRKTRISDIHHCLNQYRAKQLCHLKIDLKLDFVSSTDLEKEYISNIQQWIEFGVTRQVQHLVIIVQYKSSQELFFKPPESLFHCQSIQYLGLVCRCILDPPSDFKGFPSLKKLLLMDGKVEVESIESIVTTSPSLTLARLWAIDRGSEDLKISFSLYRRRDVTVEDEIHIYSPFNFQIILPRNQHDVRPKNVLPSLLSLKSLSTIIQTFGGGPGQIISEWGSSMANLSQVRVLKVSSLFVQAIHAKWCLQKGRQVVFESLKRLHICGKITMNFTLVALVNFLQNCPSLQSMEIDLGERQLREREQYEWVSRFMETEHIQTQILNPDGSWLHHGNIPCFLSNLQTVTLNGFSSANVQQMALIQFLLENAIILDMINLQWIGGYNKKFTDECDYVGSKVSSYCRRSPSAKIKLYIHHQNKKYFDSSTRQVTQYFRHSSMCRTTGFETSKLVWICI